MQLAVRCSLDAYDKPVLRPAQQQCTALERVKISEHRTTDRGYVVVVAVSRTRKLVDWMININGWASEPEGLLVRSTVGKETAH